MEMTAKDFIVKKLRERNPNLDEAELRDKLKDMGKDNLLKIVAAVYKICVKGEGKGD